MRDTQFDKFEIKAQKKRTSAERMRGGEWDDRCLHDFRAFDEVVHSLSVPEGEGEKEERREFLIFDHLCRLLCTDIFMCVFCAKFTK